MYIGKTVLSQLMEFLPIKEFDRCVARYNGNRNVRSFSCWDQFLCMAFAQLSYRESLRDIECCLRAMKNKLYHAGIRGKVSRSSLADANEKRDWRIYADFAQVLIHMARHGAREGTIEHEERELIERVFSFSGLTVGDVMTPHDQVFALNGTLTVAEALPQVLDGSYSRVLVYEKEPDEIQKVFHLRDMLGVMAEGKLDVTLNEISNDVEFVPQNQRIDELFATLRGKKRHIAVAVDEFGVLRGIVTLEDLMEELFGEIYDESDNAPLAIKQVSEGEIAVSGTIELRAIEEFFDLELSGKPTDTVNFWILEDIERIPEAGETFTIEGLQVKVEQASPRVIKRVVLRRPPADSIQANPKSETED